MSKNLSNVKASPKTQGGSVEEEIRKQAKTPSEVYETADALFDKIRYGKTREQRARLRQEWLDYLRSKKGWVFIDIVLGGVAQHFQKDVVDEFAWLVKEYAFTDDSKLTKGAVELKKRILEVLGKAEAERNQKLRDVLTLLANIQSVSLADEYKEKQALAIDGNSLKKAREILRSLLGAESSTPKTETKTK